MDEKEEFLQAKKYINSGDHVLEVGSGKGAFVKHLPTKHYVGLDFSQKAKEMAEKEGILIENEMIQDYAEDHLEGFDVVVSFQVLEHVSDPNTFLNAQIKALKAGGKLIIAVPSEDSFLKYANNSVLNMPPHHVTRWCDSTFEFIAEKYGLNIVDIYHEKVQEVHKKWYLNTLIGSRFFSNKLISTSIFRKIIMKFISLISSGIVKGLKNEMLPNGHTVLVVFEKK